MKELQDFLPARPRILRGFWIAAVLWLVFLVLTAYTSAATLLKRVAADDVMKAATSSAWSGRIASEVAQFLIAQVLLHLVAAVLTCVLACATAVVLDSMRHKFGRLVVGWFSLLAGASLAFNALWYPRTLIGAYYHRSMISPVGPWALGQVIYVMVMILVAVLLLATAARLALHGGHFLRGRVTTVAVALTVLIATIWLLPVQTSARATTVSDRPNVIILGIDSLRLEQLRRYGGTGLTPNLDRFLAHADLFTDATTPVARTFPSWVAILTGRSPTVTQARFNLAARQSVGANPSIGDVLRARGYRAIYSTDEVRFANIDETYGFDQVVTPRIGASDFIVGSYNELPLASVIINTRLGKWVFPFSYSNRGVATMFMPETYVDRLRREVSFEGPTLFIAHLTAAHWPYYTSNVGFEVKQAEGDDRPLYKLGLQTADRMFGELWQMLEDKGALRNALVIVLSDHGEALGLPSDSFFDTTFHVDGLRAPIKMLDFGHGQSVLSKSQYHVLVSFRSFGDAGPFGQSARSIGMPVTVEDLAPTILDFAGVPGNPLSATGQSLLPALKHGWAPKAGEPERIRYTETDLAVLPGPGGGVDEDATARQNAIFFAVDPKTARLYLRARFVPLALTYKERAAYTKDQLLAAIPAGPYAHQYLFFDFPRNRGELLLKRPADDQPGAQRLWDAMQEHFAGELKSAVAISTDDWARLEKEWTEFSAPSAGSHATQPQATVDPSGSQSSANNG